MSDDAEALGRAKQASVGQLLFKSARLLNEHALATIRARSGAEIRASHTALFPHIDLAGTRLTELAARVGISKQAVGQLVAELEEMGALERVPDPLDGRAKLIRFAKRSGRLSVFEGLAVLGEFEARLGQRLGEPTMVLLRNALLGVIDEIESQSLPADPSL